MNYPPIFAICASDATVVSLIGDSSALRFFPFGNAPQNEVKPYAVFQTASGIPENYLGNRPNIEQWTVTVECYAKTIDTVRQVAAAIRDALETECHITGWRSEEYDSTTGLYSMAFDSDWFVKRIVPPTPPVLGYPLNDDGTVAALFGVGWLETDAPDYTSADYTYTGAATNGVVVATPAAEAYLTTQAVTVASADRLSLEAEVVGLDAANFPNISLGAVMSSGGTVVGSIVADVLDLNPNGPQWGGSGIDYQTRTSSVEGFRLGIDIDGTTGTFRIKSTDGIVTSLTTFTPPMNFTAYLSVADGNNAPVGASLLLRLIVQAADYTLPCPAGAKNLTGDTIP